jgi:hypothetical protein
MFTNSEAEWFQAFRRAVLENEPDLAYGYTEDALALISKRFSDPNRARCILTRFSISDECRRASETHAATANFLAMPF